LINLKKATRALETVNNDLKCDCSKRHNSRKIERHIDLQRISQNADQRILRWTKSKQSFDFILAPPFFLSFLNFWQSCLL